ncbi:LOW QUALITY PROTEIN: hypothetical protein CVT26_002464 [Gymnopilus dilepis]|uniref:Uncharacterized protein n=1 Tax=Gymnopilus dilepis TaxID=231916 RepID=A0A409Y3R4_9AGAR|nr:LOW QUALITY PROTEIN: hypothetical protein CVT26_002464 [Gymnopilus dilepis]
MPLGLRADCVSRLRALTAVVHLSMDDFVFISLPATPRHHLSPDVPLPDMAFFADKVTLALTNLKHDRLYYMYYDFQTLFVLSVCRPQGLFSNAISRNDGIRYQISLNKPVGNDACSHVEMSFIDQDTHRDPADLSQP